MAEATRILTLNFSSQDFGVFRYILRKLKDPLEATQFCLLSHELQTKMVDLWAKEQEEEGRG